MTGGGDEAPESWAPPSPVLAAAVDVDVGCVGAGSGEGMGFESSEHAAKAATKRPAATKRRQDAVDMCIVVAPEVGAGRFRGGTTAFPFRRK